MLPPPAANDIFAATPLQIDKRKNCTLNSPRYYTGGCGVVIVGVTAMLVGRWGRNWDRRFLITLLCGGVLAACGLLDDKAIRSRVIEFEVAPRANQDSPIAVDIVYVFNPQLVSQLSGMSAHDWFLQRDQTRQAFPTDFDLTSFEVVPGQKGPIEQVSPQARNAIAAFIFADYASPGTHRARIDGLEHVFLQLGDKDFVLTPPTDTKGSAG